MKRITVKTVLLVILAAVCHAQEYKQPYLIDIRGDVPQGTIRNIGDVCRISWEVLDHENVEISTDYLSRHFKNFMVEVTQGFEEKEALVKREEHDTSERTWNWQIPEVWKDTRYRVSIVAAPAKKIVRTVRGEFFIYVRYIPRSRKLTPPSDFKTCLRILMDWNGKKGYYNRVSPMAGWERAFAACQWIREHVDSGIYRDYLTTIEKVENTGLAEFKIYCSVKTAKLRIDNYHVGFFREWDAEKKMFYLQTTLPVDFAYGYKVEISKGDQEYSICHTHTGNSEYTVEKLYKVVKLTLTTPDLSRAALEGKPFGKFGKKHVIRLYARKVQIIDIELKDGTTLQIVLNPKNFLALEIKKEGRLFILYKGEKSYDFVGNKVILLDY